MNIENQKSYLMRDGNTVKIVETDLPHSDTPVVGYEVKSGLIRMWDKEGKNEGSVLLDIHQEVPPFYDFEMDEPVFVAKRIDSYPLMWFKRHFALVSDSGKPMTFEDGKTSWSVDTDLKHIALYVDEWDYCGKAKDVEVKDSRSNYEQK